MKAVSERFATGSYHGIYTKLLAAEKSAKLLARVTEATV